MTRPKFNNLIKAEASLPKEEIEALSWCIARALHDSKGREEPENEIYWVCRENIFEYLRVHPRRTQNWMAILREYQINRHEFDEKIFRERSKAFYSRFAHPEILMNEVHDS